MPLKRRDCSGRLPTHVGSELGCLGSRSEHQSSDVLACVLPVCLAWPTAVAMAPRAGLKAAFPGMFSSPAHLVHEIL